MNRTVLAGIGTAVGSRQALAAEAIARGMEGIRKVNSTDQANHHQAGFRAEHHHAATFNADAARKGLNVRALLNKGGAPADLIIVGRGGQTLSEVQVKNCKTAARTARSVSDSKYDGMGKVVPADQADQVRDLAGRRGQDGLGHRNYADTAQKASGKVEAGGAGSQGLTYKQAQSRNLAARMAVSELGAASKAGAASGALAGGLMSAVMNGHAAVKGEKTAAEAAHDIVADTATAALGGAVSAAVTSGITLAVCRVGGQVLTKGGLPGAVASAGIGVSKDVLAWQQGRLPGAEVGTQAMGHVAQSGGAWAGALAGAAICAPIPAGPVVGGMIGGALGSHAGRAMLEKGRTALETRRGKSGGS